MAYVRSYDHTGPCAEITNLFIEWVKSHRSGGDGGGGGTDPVDPAEPPMNRSQVYTADLSPVAGSDQTLTVIKPAEWALSVAAGASLINPSLPRLGPDATVHFTTGNPADEPRWAVLHNPGPVEGGVLSFELTNASTDDYQDAYYALRADDADNLLFLRLNLRGRGVRANGSVELFERRSGQTTSLGLANLAPMDGEWLPVTVLLDPDTKQLRVKLFVRSDAPQVMTYDLSARPSIFSTKFGWCAHSPYRGTSPNIRTRALTHTVPTGALAITSTQKRSLTLVSQMAGTWAKVRPTKVQYQLLHFDTREPVTDWITSKTQTITTDGTWTTSVTAPARSSYLARARMLNDTGTVSEVGAGGLYFGVDQVEAEIGHNMRSCTYYEPHPILSNWGKFVAFPGNRRRAFIPYASIIGTHRITTNPSAGRITGFTSAGTGSVVSTDAATGQHVISITADQNFDDNHRYLDFAGDVTRFSVTTDGITGEISPAWLANMEGVGLRDLNMLGINDVPSDQPFSRNLDSDPIFSRGENGFDGAYLPVETICRAVAAKHRQTPSFRYWWHVDAGDLEDARIEAEAAYIRDNLPTSMVMLDEFLNEMPWNEGFYGNRQRLFSMGLRLGFYGAGTYTAPAAPITAPVRWLGEGGIGNSASPATPAGGRVGFNRHGVGYVIWRAKVDVPAGAEIGENTYWTLDFDINGINHSARMARAFEHHRRIQIRKRVFGSFHADRVRPVLMGQAIDGQRLDDQLALELAMPGYLDDLWGLGWGWYIYDIGVDPNATDHTIDSIEAAYRADIPRMIARSEAAWDACQRLNKKLALYEGLRHPTDYQSQGNSVYKQKQDAFWASDRSRVFVRDAVVAIRRHAPGLVMQYDAISKYYWGLRRTYADTSNPGYVGWHEGLAAPLA